MRSLVRLGVALALLQGATACQSPYERMVEREINRGVRYDSLFLGIHLGMTSEDFYSHCWQLNRDSLIKQGPTNLSVQYELPDYPSTAYLNFYPQFTSDGKIYKMPMLFNYAAWAPWNPEYQSDSLLVEVLDMFEQWYGGEFLKLEHPEHGVAYAKVDGNRQVLVHRKDDQFVKAVITDLLAQDTVQTENPFTQAP